jgi:probable HAF family extracellular repeat protein
LAAISVAQDGPSLTIKCSDVKVKIKSALETDSYAVNNAGVIAGDYVDSAGVQHGMLLAGTKLTAFDGPSGSQSIAAYGVNSSNAAAGWYVDSNGINQGFVFASGQLTPVFFPKSTGTQANGINDNGWVVGSYVDTNGVTHGFYWDTKKYKKLDVKGAASTTVWSINNANLMGVFTYDPKTKKFTNVDVPGAAGTVTHGVNNQGDINFTIFDSSSNRHGVLYQAATGVFTQFDDPKGANTTRADGINDTDVMVGRYSPASGTPANAGFKCTVK